jgi:hypothetical protein
MEYRPELFIDKRQDFLGFLKTRYSLFHLSNLFFRDLHYGVMAFLEMNKLPHAYSKSEDLARQVIEGYEKTGLLIRIDDRSWMLNYLPFKKAPTKPTAPAKPTPVTAKPALDPKMSASKTVAPAAPTASSAGTENRVAPQEVLANDTATEPKPA